MTAKGTVPRVEEGGDWRGSVEYGRLLYRGDLDGSGRFGLHRLFFELVTLKGNKRDSRPSQTGDHRHGVTGPRGYSALFPIMTWKGEKKHSILTRLVGEKQANNFNKTINREEDRQLPASRGLSPVRYSTMVALKSIEPVGGRAWILILSDGVRMPYSFLAQSSLNW